MGEDYKERKDEEFEEKSRGGIQENILVGVAGLKSDALTEAIVRRAAAFDKVTNDGNDLIRSLAIGSDCRSTVRKILAKNPGMSEDQAIKLYAQSRKGQVFEGIQSKTFNQDAVKNGSKERLLVSKKPNRQHTDATIYKNGRAKPGGTYQMKAGSKHYTLGRKHGVASPKYARDKKFVLDKDSFAAALRSGKPEIREKLARGEVLDSARSFDAETQKINKAKPVGREELGRRTEREIKKELRGVKVRKVKTDTAGQEFQQEIKAGAGAMGAAACSSAAITVVRDLVQKGEVDLGKTARVAASSALDTGIKIAAHKATQRVAEKVISKSAGKAVGKFGGPLVGCAVDAAFVAFDDSLTGEQKASKIVKSTASSLLVVGVGAVFPPAGVALFVGTTLWSIFN